MLSRIFYGFNAQASEQYVSIPGYHNLSKETFIDGLLSKMSLLEMVMQLYLMFGAGVVGPKSDNSLYEKALFPASPDAAIGVIHGLYLLNTSYFNDLQALNLKKISI